MNFDLLNRTLDVSAQTDPLPDQQGQTDPVQNQQDQALPMDDGIILNLFICPLNPNLLLILELTNSKLRLFTHPHLSSRFSLRKEINEKEVKLVFFSVYLCFYAENIAVKG